MGHSQAIHRVIELRMPRVEAGKVLVGHTREIKLGLLVVEVRHRKLGLDRVRALRFNSGVH